MKVKDTFIEIQEENEELQARNEFLQRQNKALKLRASKDALYIQELEEKIQDMRFTKNFLTSEEAGKMFARELLGGA